MAFLKVTGDGSCLFHTVAVNLFHHILKDTAPVKQKAAGYAAFLQHFADFHPNFNPPTMENLKTWLTTYAQSKRDVELLISPVLRYWYLKEKKALSKNHALGILPFISDQAEENDALFWLCQQLGFNLQLQTKHGTEQYFGQELYPTIEPGPVLTAVNKNNGHFDCYVDNTFKDFFKTRKPSALLKHHKGSTKSAYTFNSNPLPEPSVGISKVDTVKQAPKIQYNELRVLQRELQVKAMQIESMKKELQGQAFTVEDQEKSIYQFNFIDDFENIPDKDSMKLMFSLLREENRHISREKHQLEKQVRTKRNSTMAKL